LNLQYFNQGWYLNENICTCCTLFYVPLSYFYRSIILNIYFFFKQLFEINAYILYMLFLLSTLFQQHLVKNLILYINSLAASICLKDCNYQSIFEFGRSIYLSVHLSIYLTTRLYIYKTITNMQYNFQYNVQYNIHIKFDNIGMYVGISIIMKYKYTYKVSCKN